MKRQGYSNKSYKQPRAIKTPKTQTINNGYSKIHEGQSPNANPAEQPQNHYQLNENQNYQNGYFNPSHNFNPHM